MKKPKPKKYRCHECNKLFTPKSKDYGDRYWCWECDKAYHRKYELNQTRTRRVSTIIDGKEVMLYGKKGPYPEDGKCPICKKLYKKLSYHHWDDKDISRGLWCCNMCNQMCDRIDDGQYHWVYLRLRGEIEDRLKKEKKT